MTTTQPPGMTQTSPPPPCTFDDEYYWDFVTFSVQDRLYRVPKYRFISDSESFASNYGLDGETGGSDSSEDPLPNAVKLDVAFKDFTAFLRVLYPKKAPAHGGWALSTEEWLAVLKLSTKWLFNDIRKIAIDELTKLNMDATDQVILGREYAVESWFLAGCEDLVKRDAVISNQEAQKIRWETANGLWAVREAWRSRKSLGRAYDAGTAIRDLFASDFEIIKSSQISYMTSTEKEEAVARQELAEEQKREALDRAREEAEYDRLRMVAEEERKKLQVLEGQLDQQRRNLEALGVPSPRVYSSPIVLPQHKPASRCSSPSPSMPAYRATPVSSRSGSPDRDSKPPAIFDFGIATRMATPEPEYCETWGAPVQAVGHKKKKKRQAQGI